MTTPAELTTYRPEEGTLVHRVLQLVARMPDEEYTSGDLASKFSCRSNALLACLATPLRLGLLTHQQRAGDDSKLWRAGPNLAAWIQAQVAAATPAAAPPPPRSQPAPAAAPAAPRRYRRLNPEAVQVHKGRPIPEATGGRGITSTYGQLAARMAPGDMVELDDRAAASLLSYLRKHKVPHTVRRLGTGTKGIWRTA